MAFEPSRDKPAGYAFLADLYQVRALPNWHWSLVSSTGTIRTVVRDGQVEVVYPLSYWPGDSAGDHLEFAMKYDGVNLGLLSAIFKKIDAGELAAWVRKKPTGKYARRVWFYYEFLTGEMLDLPDLTMGNYVEALDSRDYYTSLPGSRSHRHRITNNLLGVSSFCPIIRRTEKLKEMEGIDLRKRCEEVITVYPKDLLRRALSYLYSKETRSSFAIEHITPSASRAERFVGMLEMAENRDFCDKSQLIKAQNRIVDTRFQDSDYRSKQNYVGQSIAYQRQIVHYVCPKPEDIEGLMEGLISSHKVMKEGSVPALVHAAAVSYGFVFLHPFEDGNGRIHRFLIHNILFLDGAIPKGLMFPVSAAMLKNPGLYDQSLEAFAKPLVELVEYDLDDLGQMTVHGDTGNLYRYVDMTAQAEALYDFVRLTVEHELVEELDYLASYDKTRTAIQKVIDMPDNLIDLFIKFCLQNNGRLSERKRESHFSFLSDNELREMENAVMNGYKKAD